MTNRRIGLLGFGKLGSYVFDRAKNDSSFDVDFVYDIDKKKTANLDDRLVLKTPEDFGLKKVDLVVEVADFRAVESFAPTILENNSILILSVSALADEVLNNRLMKICREYDTAIFISHGALLGTDGLQDTRDSLKEVNIVTSKNPRNIDFSFTDQFRREDISERTIIYDGPTRGACKIFPRNLNSHAVVAISGIGFDRTRSKFIADPETTEATHHITARGENSSFEIIRSSKIEGVTGDYTLFSVYGTIRRILAGKAEVNIF